MLLSVQPHFSFTPTGSGGVDAIFNLTHFIFHLSYHIDMDKPLMFQLFNVNYSPYICHLPFSHINSLICHFHFFAHIYLYVSDNLTFCLLLSLFKPTSTFTLAGGGVCFHFNSFHHHVWLAIPCIFFTRKEGRRVRLGLCATLLAPSSIADWGN